MGGRITVTGLVSGIDFNSIISQLIQIERDQRIAPIERSIQKNIERIDKLREFNSLIGAVKSAAAKLNTVSGARPKTATSSDTNKIRISSVGSNALTGAYPITQVRKLAQGEILASMTTLGGGAISDNTLSFGIKSNGVTRSVSTVDFSTIDPEDQLAQLATDINQDAGDIVNAFVVNSGTDNARLMIVAKNTGSTLGGGDAVDDSRGALGDISFSLNSGSAALTDFKALGLVSTGYAGDALTIDSEESNVVQDNLDLSLSVGNVAFSFDTNSVSTLIPGVGLEFISTFGSGTVTLTVNNDTATLQNNIQSLVDAVNNVQTFVKKQTTFDEETQTAGILQSDSAVRQMRDSMISALGLDVIGQPKNYRNAPDMGLEFDRTGLLLFDTADLQSRMASSFADVGELFRGYKFTSDNFTKTANNVSLSGGTVNMSFNIKGITISVSGTVTAGDNQTQLNSLRDIINEDGRGILNARVVEQPDGTVRLALYGDNILYDEDVKSLSSGSAEVTLGLVSGAGFTTVKNTSPGIGSRLEDILKDLINGTGSAAGILQSEMDQLGDLNFFYNQRLQDQEDYIAGIEERLQKKFTALESALANFQSQGDFLASRSGIATGK
ncbi:MAG: flagellar filament capping protein FliD [Nitrospirae bacterium]|nr:flagellar filament capping protein FliD [Nitrospirota bacterium]